MPNDTHDVAMLNLFDRRVEQIESALSVVTDQLHEQSRSLNQITEALTAVVRLEERLTASIENGKEQRASIQRVHDRMDVQAKERDEQLAEIYKRIEAERRDCQVRFAPLNDEVNQQKGATRFAAFVFPVIVTVVLALLGSFVSGMQSELKDLSRAVALAQADSSVHTQQLKQLSEARNRE